MLGTFDCAIRRAKSRREEKVESLRKDDKCGWAAKWLRRFQESRSLTHVKRARGMTCFRVEENLEISWDGYHDPLQRIQERGVCPSDCKSLPFAGNRKGWGTFKFIEPVVFEMEPRA